MSDLLLNLANNPSTKRLVKLAGLPSPARLSRTNKGYDSLPLSGKNILIGQSKKAYAIDTLNKTAKDFGGEIALHKSENKGSRYDALILDATGCEQTSELEVLYTFFHSAIANIDKNARVLIVNSIEDGAVNAERSACINAIKGFGRALAKELGRKGATVNTICLAKTGVDRLPGVMRFFLGPQTTYVTGQVIELNESVTPPSKLNSSDLLKGKVAVVTGSAGGIGAATAERLIQEGARVVCLDVPMAEAALKDTCKKIGADALALDITDSNAASTLANYILREYGGVDIVVHNAGITRDRTLAKMEKHFWDKVIDVNLAAVIQIDKTLEQEGVLNDGARIICLSSVSGIAGNFGQCNYAASKAALIGYVQCQAKRLATRGISVNAVAPGFIETAMTKAMPVLPREAGRRLNSLKQGGQPRDAAELITFLSTPESFGVSGQLIRVCGQALIGA